MQEQEKKGRLRGLQAHKANIVAAKSVARLMRSSLGPKGMDKMMQSPDGDILISESPTPAPGTERGAGELLIDGWQLYARRRWLRATERGTWLRSEPPTDAQEAEVVNGRLGRRQSAERGASAR